MGYYPRPDGGGYDSYSPGGYSHTDGHHNPYALQKASSDYSGGGGGGSGGGGGEDPFWMQLLLPVLVPLVMIGVPLLIWLIYKGFVSHPIESVMIFAVAIIATGWAKYHERRSRYLPSRPKRDEAYDRATKMGRLAVLLWWAAVLVTVALSVKTVFLTPQPEPKVQRVQKGNREYVRGHGPVKKLLWQEAPGPKVNWIVVSIELYRRSPADRSVPKAEVKRLLEELADPVTGGLVGLLLNFDADEYARHSLRARVRLEELRLAEPTKDALRDNPDHPRHPSLKMRSE